MSYRYTSYDKVRIRVSDESARVIEASDQGAIRVMVYHPIHGHDIREVVVRASEIAIVVRADEAPMRFF